MGLLLTDVEVEGRRVDVRVLDGVVAEVGPGLRTGNCDVFAGSGGALLPGLHDHHLHLLALAAAMASVDCGPPAVCDVRQLAAALSSAPGTDWIRGTGYHESVAGSLDRWLLDRLSPDRPVRVQHRGGALWMLNSPALARVGAVLDDSADVERSAHGEPNGRLWRYDTRLRLGLPADETPDLGTIGRLLSGYGLTGVTDATPDLEDSAVGLLAEARATGRLAIRIHVLGIRTGSRLPPGFTAGPFKFLLRDHDLPTFEELSLAVAAAHEGGRAVAVHCVTRDALLLTLAVLDEVGPLRGDRLEHAGVVPGGTAADIARLGLRVVTQPDFLRTRGDDYLREAEHDDVSGLYPWATLVSAGVPVAGSSDAPFGALDPWQVIRSAVDRTTASGRVVGYGERVQAATALAGYLSAPQAPGGPPRRVIPGATADLCLLASPLPSVLAEPDARQVRLVVSDGRPVHAEPA